MTLDFQRNIVRYFLDQRGKKYLKLYGQHIESDVFDTATLQLIYQLITGYFEKYKTVPTKENLLEYLHRETSHKKVTQEAREALENEIRKLYLVDLGDDTKIIKDSIITFAQRKLTKEMFKEFAPKLKNLKSDDTFAQLKRKISKIANLEKLDEMDKSEGVSIMSGRRKRDREATEVLPTKYHGVNQIMKRGGFNSPQVIVVMAGPKAGKTTLMVNLGNSFMIDGYPVLYIDTENGEDRIEDMSHQNLLQCDYKTLDSGELDDTLDSILSKAKHLGADMKIRFMPPKRCSTDDVRDMLDRLEEEENFIPKVIIADYFDNMKPEDKSVKDKRLQLQEVYIDWKVLAAERGFLVITPSQVNRKAMEKAEFTMGDIAEDFGKVANADSIWAFMRTPEEKEDNVGRLIPVANRDGKDYGTVYLQVDPETVTIEEVDLSKMRRRA